MFAKPVHPLQLAIFDLNEQVKPYSFITLSRMSPTGILIPTLPRRGKLPSSLSRLVKAVQTAVANCRDFEEFAIAINGIAEYAQMTADTPSGLMSYLHGKNFFIELPTVPNLVCTAEMVKLSKQRRAVVLAGDSIPEELRSAVEVEYFLSNQLQLELWLQGHSVHNEHGWYWSVNNRDEIVNIHKAKGGECCPDFSCCDPALAWSPEQRSIFSAASKETRTAMLMNTMQELMLKVDPGLVSRPKTLNS